MSPVVDGLAIVIANRLMMESRVILYSARDTPGYDGKPKSGEPIAHAREEISETSPPHAPIADHPDKNVYALDKSALLKLK